MVALNDNFKKAMNELFGTDLKVDENPEAPEVFEEPEEILCDEWQDEPKKTYEYAPTEEPPQPIVREEAVIPAGMVITGNITTKSNMRIMGDIIGNVDCEGKAVLVGSITGNVAVGSLAIQKGRLEGDVNAAEDVAIEAGSALKGNLAARNVICNSATEGEIKASGTVELKAEACVTGDINAASLTMAVGAKIRGMVNVSE